MMWKEQVQMKESTGTGSVGRQDVGGGGRQTGAHQRDRVDWHRKEAATSGRCRRRQTGAPEVAGAQAAAAGRDQRRMIDRWGRAGSTFNYD